MAPLGSGGMGEVYRARDTRLNRDVAIKVLPPVFAGDPDRLARFEREAQVLASLNHPGIAHVYGVEESIGAGALVMELVEGPTLAEKLSHGSGLMADGSDSQLPSVSNFDLYVVSAFRRTTTVRLKPDTTYLSNAV